MTNKTPVEAIREDAMHASPPPAPRQFSLLDLLLVMTAGCIALALYGRVSGGWFSAVQLISLGSVLILLRHRSWRASLSRNELELVLLATVILGASVATGFAFGAYRLQSTLVSLLLFASAFGTVFAGLYTLFYLLTWIGFAPDGYFRGWARLAACLALFPVIAHLTSYQLGLRYRLNGQLTESVQTETRELLRAAEGLKDRRQLVAEDWPESFKKLQPDLVLIEHGRLTILHRYGGVKFPLQLTLGQATGKFQVKELEYNRERYGHYKEWSKR